ncbi:MAG TPA: hypothetical protein VMP00_09505, partial [Burkholderiales bacterium]|nr:hypothetical protein [Burkholderiales bacterium]
MKSRNWLYALFFLAAVGVAAALLAAYAALVAYPRLPSVELLASYQPKIPLQIFSAEGELIGEFGEERRAFVRIVDVPERLK